MTLKTVVDSIDGLDPAVAKEYTKGDDGKFYLDHEDKAAIDAMRRARDNEKTEHSATKEKLRTTSTQIETLTDQIADLKAGKQSPEDKAEIKRLAKELGTLKEASTAETQRLRSDITRMTADETAKSLSKDLTDNGDLLYPHIRQRLSVKFDEAGSQLVVLDKDGKESTQKVEDLRAEFAKDSRFANVIKGSKGSGGGGRASGGGGSGGGGAAYPNQGTTAEKAAWLKANRTAE